MTLLDIARRLYQLGHAPEFQEFAEPFLLWVLKTGGDELIARYQRFHGLPETGWLCDATTEHLEKPRCGHPDVMAIGAESRWAMGAIQYFQSIAYPGVDPAEIAADYAEAIRRWTAVCGIAITPAADASTAQIVASSGQIDGQWNVLALTELPPPGAGQGVVLHQTFDAAETLLTRDQRIAMNAHEAGHFLGLGHAAPGSGNLMEPVLGSIGSPQAGDTAEVQGRYGKPPATSPAAPVPIAPKPGPPATTELITAVAGSLKYTFDFEIPGTYLVVIVPLQ